MIDFIEYVVAELKSKRLSKADAAALVKQFSHRSSSSTVASALHPLLHNNTSDLNEQRYSSVFTGEEFFLADHRVRVDGCSAQRVLPGVACLEMARAAIEQASPELPGSASLELRSTVWVRPIVISGSRQVSVALLMTENDEIDYEIYSEDGDHEVVHCQGRAIWTHQAPPARLDLTQLKRQMQQGTLAPNEVYAAFDRIGLLYGPAFQAITAIYRGSGQILAHLRLPKAAEENAKDYVLHPSLMDSALQACAGLLDSSSQSANQPRLPFALDSLRIISPCSPEMFAWMRFALGSQAGDKVVKLDIILCDEHGNICVEMQGFSSRFLKNDERITLHSFGEIESGLQSFVPVWNPIRPQTLKKADHSVSTKVLLLDADQTRLAWIQKSHPSASLLPLLPTSTIESIQAQLKDCSFDHLLWIAPDVNLANARYGEDDDQLIEQQEVGVLRVFRIVKALLGLGYGDKELQWTVITGKTQRIKKNEQIQPAHAGIFGLIGSLAKEYPHWKLSLLDVDSLQSISAKECLSIIPDIRGNGLAYCQGEWFCQQFAHIPVLPQSSSVTYRQKGVYVVIGGAGGLGEAWSRFMIERYQASVVWIGRRKCDAAIEYKINALGRLGQPPLYISADATNLDALEQACKTILKTYPAIHGVVHSAIILHDQSLARMEELEFRASLSAKVDISVNMDRVFGKQELDFMLFFSSLISFFKNPGQSNYAAGCTFKDSFAQKLQTQHAYPIKIMSWGYWGKVGIVADEHYNRAIQRMGMGSIEPMEGMASLQAFVDSELDQMALVKTIDAQAIADVKFSERLTYYPKSAAASLHTSATSSLKEASAKPLPTLGEGLQTTVMDALLAEIVASTLISLGLFQRGIQRITDLPLEKQPAPFYERWLSSSIAYLQQQGLLGEDLTVAQKVRPLANLWLEWEEKKSVWASNPDLAAQIALLEACLKGLPGILTGKQVATDVIFPNSSMRLVEGVYHGNALADYFNELLGDTLLACIQHKRLADKECKIRILEIGAGTGGTTTKLLPLLQRFPIDEYCYTDVSRAFLMRAEEQYQSRLPALTTAIFDVSKPLALQSIAADCYDVAIAANVLHATPNIRETLRNAKATLRNQGVLLINEISTWSLLAHLTFGLLEGWWLHEDIALRLPGSPGLTPEKWQEILAEEGFESISFPAREAHKFGQQIIAASSNGWIRQQLSQKPNVASESKTSVSTIPAPAPKKESACAEEPLREKCISYFQKLVGSTLKMRPEQLQPRRPLAEYGLDSILVGQLTYQLRRVFTDVTGTLFFEVQTIDGLVDYFLENKKEELVTLLSVTPAGPQQSPPAPAEPGAASGRRVHRQRSRLRPAAEQKTPAGSQKERQQTLSATPDSAALKRPMFDVAVVGLSGRYPRSNNLKEFWLNLSNGVNCITEIPRDRWNWEKYYDPEKGKSGKIYTRWGGFIEGIDLFDPLFFKISPKEAKRMDPQERIFLESCYHAIEDAGYTPENLGAAEKIGVFVGVMNSRYTPQPVHSSIANRISYLFNFQGPSMAVDTACSASLTAIHVALESLYSGESTCAIAGGVNLIIDPVHYMQLTEMTMLSSGNQCKAFGAQADGFIDAEGVGAVVLKPLPQAQQDGDHVYGIIKGSAINAGGRTNGYTVPNPKAQARLVSEALERANVPAEYVSYVEAHGTGTALGDPIEVAGLTRAFKETKDKKQFCSIGSLKSNIGHCESAAGIAGLTKVLLQLKYQQLVPSLHSDIHNSEIDFGQTPFKVQKTLQNWQRLLREVNGVVQEIPRIAGVSSFGAGGANAHIIVQEYLPALEASKPAASCENTNISVVLSARNTDQLKQKASDLLAFIRDEQSIDLAALAYTLQVGREAMEERLALLVDSIEELANKLQAYVTGEQSIEGAYQGQAKRNQEALSLFSTDVDLQQTIEKWIVTRKLSKLLELWVKGLEMDWGKLYGQVKPQRMSLPTYPFARERYWTDGTASSSVCANGAVSVFLHPLLHRNTSDLSEQRYSATFTGEEFFVADHLIKANCHGGQKVLPAVIYLEMARAGIEQAMPARPQSTVLELNNTVWAHPIVVNENKQVSIALSATDNDEIAYEIYSQDADQEIVHCQGRGVWTHQVLPEKLDLKQLQGQMGQGRLEPDSVYAACARMGLIYGPTLKGIFILYQGNNQVLVHLRLPKAIEDTSAEYILHPSLMDGALQACVGLIHGLSESSCQPRLPFALETLRIVSPCTREMFGWVRFSPGSHADDDVVKLDIDLCDQGGNICVQMRGLSSRMLNGEIVANAAQSKTIGSLLAVPGWHASNIVSSSAGPVAYAEHHILVCELSQVAVEKLASLLLDSQCFWLQAPEQRNIAERYSEYALMCFERIQTVFQGKPQGKVLFQIVVTDDSERAVMAGLSGLLQTASQENPQFIGQLLLVPPQVTTKELAGYLQAEIPHPLSKLVRYQQGGRQVLRWQEVSNAEAPPVAFKDHGVYLITGGLGGLGILFAKEIIKQTHGARVVLTGRSSLRAENRILLDELSAHAGLVNYRQADVSDLEQVKQLIAAIQAEYGKLNGILHGAGIIADDFILKKAGAEFRQVLAPKVTGAYNLDQASQDVELDFFVLFSSIAGAMGNPGQGDYAAANGFMDQFAAYRNRMVGAKQRHGRTRSINWPLWQAGGMASDAASRERLQETTGMQPMETATGMEAFYRTLALSYEQMLVVEGDLPRLRRALLAGATVPVEQAKLPVPEVEIDAESLAEKTQEYLRRQFSELLQLPFHRIDPQAPLENYGIDSILALKLTNQLEKTFGSLSKTLFFEYQTIAALAGYFLKAHPAIVREQIGPLHGGPRAISADQIAIEKRRPTPALRSKTRFFGPRINDHQEIAIVGLAGRYPQAEDLQEFWRNLQNGRDSITEIPLERWDNSLYYHPDRNQPGKSYSKWGGFIADVDKFDPLFFNISPKEAALIDPQERLFLETAWETIEDAGYTRENISGGRVGVFVGVMWGQYELFGAESILNGDAVIPSSSHASIANRVSYFFDFHGPSIALDTMCSSSLTAIHLACAEIRKGEIDAAIAGGVNVTVHPCKYLSLSQGKFAASDGKCRSFGEGGDGYVPGEGVGAVLVKRLRDAVRDGDQIYAVIKASSLNHGGKTNGYTVPNPNAQGDLILDALRKANIDPRTLGYIETHGTGTSLGDPIEVTGLLKAFEGSTAEKQFCPIGSVKSNIGHLESAAGIAAVTKTLLQIKYKQLVPSLHAHPPNPNINFKDSPFYVQTELTEWKRAAHSRRAGVSSFGAGGSNAHLLLEEYADTRAGASTSQATLPQAFVLSAKDQTALCRYAEKIIKFLKDSSNASLTDIAYTSQVGRSPMDARLAVIASTVQDLRSKLEQWIILGKNKGLGRSIPELEGVFDGNLKDAQYSAGNLIEGRAGKAFLQDLLANRDLEKLARLWVLGVGMDWSIMYRPATPKKVSLPTYPFAKERCWIEPPRPIQKHAPRPPKAVPPVQPDDKQRTYHQIQWTLKSVATPQKPRTIGPILMLDSSEELFHIMKDQRQTGLRDGPIVLLKPGRSFQEVAPDIYLIDHEREEQFHELIDRLKNKAQLPRVVLHHDSEICNLEIKEQVAQHLNRGIHALSCLSKALMKEGHRVPLRIMSVFARAEATAPLGAAIGGFFKTLTLENPRYLAKAIEVQSDLSYLEKANFIWDEIYEEEWIATEIRYRTRIEMDNEIHERFTCCLVQHAPAAKIPLPLRENGVYLITGGLGGLGFIFSDYLAKNFQTKLVLVGRSAPDARQIENLTRLKGCGAEALVLQADVTKLEDMEMVVREAKTRFSAINGIIHAAGVIRDSLILKKTREEMEAVLAPKIYGTINLDQATRSENLDFFVLFSSVVGIMGNFGQSDYAYGNHFLDSFAETREELRRAQKRSGQTLSINWPLWEEGGMRISPDDVTFLERQTGISPLPTKEGISYWEDFLRSESVQGIALYGVPSRIADYLDQTSVQSHSDLSAAPEKVDAETLFTKTEAYLKTLIGEEIKLTPDRIGSADRLESFGIDSVMIHQLNTRLEKDLGGLPKTLLYELETVHELARFLLHEKREALIALFGFNSSASTPAISPASIDEETVQDDFSATEEKDNLGPIAIIGIHGHYPHSVDLAEYWENLKQGRDLIDLVPPNRWDYEEFYDPNPAAASEGKIYCKWGGFLEDHDKFDPHFFNISPEEAKIIDPQERLFLQSVWAAIEDAGYTRDSLKKRSPKAKSADVGVFVGVTTNSYHLWAPEERNRGNIVCPSALPWSIANRVSYFFDFNGPSMPVDTACSSSLVAVHLACESLKNRECQVAIAGGVNLYLHPSKYQSLCHKRMLSLQGRCHSYGAGDDGFVPGEGIGTVVLKPLSKAMEHQDHIYAVISASAFDHSGRSNGYSAPNPNSQASLISQTLNKAHAHPETIDYIEGHGTGTQLGDSIEIAALTQAFRKQTKKKQFCPIGSVKANVGHSESAAGIAGIAKVVLQLNHKQLAPSIYSDQVNPNIEFRESPFYLQHELSEWKSSPSHPRRALINSFGAGGVNACLVIEEFREPGPPNASPEGASYLFTLSARNEDRLREYASRLLTHLGGEQTIDLAGLCYTLQVGREAMQERLALVVAQLDELIDRLGEWTERGASANVYRGSRVARRGARQPLKVTKVAEQDLIALASKWVGGGEIDWESLYTEKPRRISLPSYPFARERYWISDSPILEKRTPVNAELHPLISYNSSSLKEVSFSSSLSDTAFYAVDHKVNDEGIFPGAGFLEMACIAGTIAGEQSVRKIKDIVWMQPLSFRKGPQALRTSLKYVGDSVEYLISSLDEENEAVVHSEGRLAFRNGWSDPVVCEDQIPIQTLKAQSTRFEDGAAYYNQFRKYGLNYGPSFQTIQEIYSADSFALSKLKLAEHLKNDFGQFILHPSIMDGALQTVAGLIGGLDLVAPHLPFSLDEIEIAHPVRQICYAYAEYADPHERNQTRVKKFNIRLLNESGDVLINFKDLFVRPLPKVEARASLAATAAAGR